MSSFVRRYAIAAIIVSILLFPASAFAAVEIGASPNPVGSGARAMGMGGAFIAVADDATAASWNPAGLVQLERPEISAVGSYLHRLEDMRGIDHPELYDTNRTESWDLNYLSMVYPFTVLDRNVTVSLNYQRLYDMNRDFNGKYNLSAGPLTFKRDLIFEQRGGLSTVSPAVAFQITPDLSLGFTYNFWVNPFEDNGWTSYNRSHVQVFMGTTPVSDTVNTSTDDIDFFGRNFHAGVMYNVTPNFTVAGVYKDGFKARLKHFYASTDTDPLGIPAVSFKDYMELTMPRSYGIGVSYRYSDSLTLALDAYRTEWSEFIMDYNGDKWRPNIGKLKSESTMDATTQVRAGLEYLVIMPTYTVPLRFGAFYDPDPSENSPNDFFGFSLGSGIAVDSLAFDIAYTFRTGDSNELLFNTNADSYVYQHEVMFSMIYYLDWLDF